MGLNDSLIRIYVGISKLIFHQNVTLKMELLSPKFVPKGVLMTVKMANIDVSLMWTYVGDFYPGFGPKTGFFTGNCANTVVLSTHTTHNPHEPLRTKLDTFNILQKKVDGKNKRLKSYHYLLFGPSLIVPQFFVERPGIWVVRANTKCHIRLHVIRNNTYFTNCGKKLNISIPSV